MSDQTGSTGDETFDDEPTAVPGAQVPGAGPPRLPRSPRSRRKTGNEEVKRSALMGFMSVPVHRRFPIRRSTLVMAVAFLGLGALLYFYPAQSDTTSGPGSYVNGPNGTTVWVPNASLVSTTTTSTSTTTTTTRPPTTTSTPVPHSSTTTTTTGSSTTTLGSSTTTLGRPNASTTTTTPGSGQTAGTGTVGTSRSTTTTRPASSTTTTTTATP